MQRVLCLQGSQAVVVKACTGLERLMVRNTALPGDTMVTAHSMPNPNPNLMEICIDPPIYGDSSHQLQQGHVSVRCIEDEQRGHLKRDCLTLVYPRISGYGFSFSIRSDQEEKRRA